jgi:hypothetical protein
VNGCDCGDCQGPRDHTPVRVDNLPGLRALAYRTGTHARFKASMLAGLSRSQDPVLGQLRTRDDDDFSIALLDLWATVADVLTFYQERIANEGYLRTAAERRSVLELARAIGYELRPGVAATALLAFTLDTAPGAPTRTVIDLGVGVRSLPDPGETAQVFETVERIEGRVAWNGLRPSLTTRHRLPLPPPLDDRLVFAGIDTNLKLGDGVYFRDAADQAFFGVVTSVTPQPEQPAAGTTPAQPARTTVTYRRFGTSPSNNLKPDLTTSPPPLGELAARYDQTDMSAADLELEAATAGFGVQELFDNFAASPLPPPNVLVFRTRAAVQGHNAPDYRALPFVVRDKEFVNDEHPTDPTRIIQKLIRTPYFFYQDRWVETTLARHVLRRPPPAKPSDPDPPAEGNTVYLDNAYPAIVPGSLVVLQDGAKADTPTWALHRVEATAELGRSAYTLTARGTRLTLDDAGSFDKFGIRNTVVFGQSELLPLAAVPDERLVDGDTIELDGLVEGLRVGRRVVISGESATTAGLSASEASVLTKVSHRLARDGRTTITLADPLTDRYRRLSVAINANVVLATHGERREEILGSGDGSQPFQRFTLRQSPLTYLSAGNASGAETTLSVFVNDLRWQEVPALHGRGPDERVYVTRLHDDGTTTVQFGDGRTGARLPTGVENVRASYRVGAGLAGRVKAGQLSLPVVKPPGVAAVTNPRPASGGSDRETLTDAAANAPVTVLTLDRIVSLLDYESFARAFAGVAKALATWTRTGDKRGVLLTVAGTAGAAIAEDDPVHTSLLAAILQAGDPFVPVRLESYRRRFFRLAANLKLDPAYQARLVVPAAERALRAAFGFEARSFGQPVAESEVIAVLHGVAGVVAVKVTALHHAEATPEVRPVVEAASPRPGADADVQPAELLLLDPGPLQLGSLP